MSTVWVVEYSHKHGTDLNAYASGELAEASIYATMREFMGDFEERDDDSEKSELVNAIRRDDMATATEIWAGVLGETFEVHELTVRGPEAEAPMERSEA